MSAARRRGLTGVAAGVAMAVAAGAFAAPAFAGASGGGHDGGHGDRHRATQKAMEEAVNANAPGVTAQVRDKHGTWDSAAGIGDLRRQSPRGAHDRYRVGSITKTFVSTVILQLAAEGELSLDDKVGRWLPGVVEGNGHDGDAITVRQLLNHTSGIYDVLTDPGYQKKMFTEQFLEHRYDTWTPQEQVAIAMRHEPDFDPGKGWNYSNTNYILAGMIIKKVTGKSYGHEIERRIIEPLGLDATSVPKTDPSMPQPSSRAYMKLSKAPGARFHDVTELNPTMAGSSGGMISDADDLNRFYTALLRGRLLPKKQLAEMKTTVPQNADEPDGDGYGLGLVSRETPCGTVLWGNGGDIQGSTSMTLVTERGGHALSANFNSLDGDLFAIRDAEFCKKK
ncbi:serine hydrolase domain-containing protein [Streptomyces sp. NPDC050439]|uniref:serine hydrolase domain-containing protein n=1 Tax=unclassified Streptomyces TaxID=2593676 RepID=UPI003430F49F